MRTRPPFCPSAKLRPRSRPRPRFGIRRNVPLRSLAAGAASARGGKKPPAGRFCLLVFGRCSPRRAKKRQCGLAETPILQLSHPPPERAQNAPAFCLSTPHSTGLVSTTLHKAGSLLREDKNRSGRAFVIRGTNANPSFSSLRKPAALFSGRFRAACVGPLWLRLRRASLRSLRSKECFLNLRIQSINHPLLPTLRQHRPSTPERASFRVQVRENGRAKYSEPATVSTMWRSPMRSESVFPGPSHGARYDVSGAALASLFTDHHQTLARGMPTQRIPRAGSRHRASKAVTVPACLKTGCGRNMLASAGREVGRLRTCFFKGKLE